MANETNEEWTKRIVSSLPIEPYYAEDGIIILNSDCRDILPHLPKFDLLLTDPPYGIGADKPRGNTGRNKHILQKIYPDISWDIAPDSQFIFDCTQSAKLAIVWGGNYFCLPATPTILVWDKVNGTNRYADCEIAWSNMGGAARIFKWKWHGFLQDESAVKEPRFHPTQKPLKVISWCLSLAGDIETVLDPFMGSGTTLVAAKMRGLKAVGIEREKEYCDIAIERMAQGVLFGGDQ